MTQVYCFTGYPAAGKSAASDIAADANIPVVEMGSVVRNHAHAELGPNASSNEIGEWATEHREAHGNDVFAHYTADAVEDLDADTVVIDGIRTPTEIAVFRDRFDDVTVTLVTASFETRLERIQSRGREDEGEYTADDLRNRDSRESMWGLKDILSQDAYDTRIENEGAFEDFETEVTSLVNADA